MRLYRRQNIRSTCSWHVDGKAPKGRTLNNPGIYSGELECYGDLPHLLSSAKKVVTYAARCRSFLEGNAKIPF
jgi:hypothetical protein